MAGLLGLLFLLPTAHAFDINEEIYNVRILDVHPQNILVLNRGLEDGMFVGAHAKMRSAEGYVARGICIKAGMLTSHWRLYRVVDPQLISRDASYTLVGMEQSEATPQMGEVRATDYSRKVPDYDESKLLPKPPEVRGDLPEDLLRDQRYLDSLKTKQTLFLERTFDKQKMRRDFRIFTGSLYASPFSVQKGPNNVQNYLYGATVGNTGKNYLTRASFDKVSLRATDQKAGQDVVNDATTLNGNFTIRDIGDHLDAFSDVTWRQARYGNDYAPRQQYLIAPLGFNWRWEPTEHWKRIEFSYAPTYDTRVHESRNTGSLVSPTRGAYDNSRSDGIRHAFKLTLQREITPDFKLKNEFTYRPRQDLAGWAFDAADNLSQDLFEASWRISGRWFAAYEFRWMDDAQLRRMNHMTRVITINSFNIRYDFEI